MLQTNNAYDKLINLVEEHKPDVLLTMETNQAWENALTKIEAQYSYTKKVPKENTYGIHLYTNLTLIKAKVHYPISNERPAIEAHLRDVENNDFIFWGIHPPPPSPTEKPTAKQKNAELMYFAELIRKSKSPCIIMGDFNNVCWSASSKMFSKVSKLKDARLKNGIHGTFPVKPKILRFPIDLVFYSAGIKVYTIKTLRDINSDHLPFFSKFAILSNKHQHTPPLKPELKEEVNDIIEEGHKAAKEEN